MLQKVVFSSDELPDHLDDCARFDLWRDMYLSRYGAADMSRLPDRPFFTRSVFTQIGSIGLVQSEGSLARMVRNAQHVAADARDDFIISVSTGGAPVAIAQRRRELVTPQTMFLYSTADATEARASGDTSWSGLCVPRARLLELVGNAEDLVLTSFEPTPAQRMLRRYLDLLLKIDPSEDDAALQGHLNTTLLDLIALTLGAKGDAREMASQRGLRAARAREIVALIKSHYSDPGFSPHDVGRKLGVSQRYLQELLQETGASFTERVLELRLQKACAMLGGASNDRLKVSEIAYACGFAHVSYFNLCFRRRFGASPRQFRGRD
jgi:AraC-like DNA-binding protein